MFRAKYVTDVTNGTCDVTVLVTGSLRVGNVHSTLFVRSERGTATIPSYTGYISHGFFFYGVLIGKQG